jgi:hypothetical protein
MRHTQVEKVTLHNHTYTLEYAEEREALALAIDQEARKASSVVEREKFLAAMQQALEVALPRRTNKSDDDPQLPMTWEEIREMEQSGLVSFGAHTMNHPLLAYLTDEKELGYEVEACRKILEEQLGHPVRSFAYPVGKMRHFGDRAVQAVKAAGYLWALTTVEEVNTSEADPYLLARLPGDVELHWLVMAAELAGLLGIWSRFKKRVLSTRV